MEQPKQQQRRHQRYDVRLIASLKGWLDDQERDTEWLANISESGAGFYSRLPLGSIKVGRNQFCWFKFPGILEGKVQVSIKIVHMSEVKDGDDKAICYGVEFAETERYKVAPIIHALANSANF